jgi:nucleotide-binding universal stress UspA family protein
MLNERGVARSAKEARGTIVLATDFSRPARGAFVYALRFASMLQSRLILLHVVKGFPDFDSPRPSIRRSVHSVRTRALLELGRMARTVQDAGITAQPKLLVGIPEDSILKMAKEAGADMIAVGTHGRTGWDRLQLGSVAEAMLRKAPCSVLTVHGATVADIPLNPRRVKLERILVAMDFATSSQVALRLTAFLAQRFNARAVLVHALIPASLSRPGRRHAGESIRHTADRRLQQAVAAAQAEDYIIERIVEAGDPVGVILDQAKEMMADLIVMGTDGRRGLQSLVAGSVATSVVRRAGCPVLVAKGGMTAWRST